ncbi:UBP-type zinc finger domain-containing protein [Aeromicrobium sp. CTD01-1L150]|uniref:UBP-type zinc finger domain-containing protein n=1 Tax=Aeromicrobium sp. CTD01-1L150 TaxID=3341830 RepID=UPI0035C08A15
MEIDPQVPPSGTGCVECLQAGGWWVHLRRCVACGHVGCCDSSPGQHARAHYDATGHRVMASFEPGEDWFHDFVSAETSHGPALAPPSSRPEEQPVPGPAGAVPDNWRSLIHR